MNPIKKAGIAIASIAMAFCVNKALSDNSSENSNDQALDNDSIELTSDEARAVREAQYEQAVKDGRIMTDPQRQFEVAEGTQAHKIDNPLTP